MKNSLEVDTVTAPSTWASALVNGDTSGLDDDDASALSRWEAELGKRGWYVVSTVDDQEPRFTWHYRMYGGAAQGGEVIDYVVHRQRSPKRKKK